jgi:hypothetical protein
VRNPANDAKRLLAEAVARMEEPHVLHQKLLQRLRLLDPRTTANVLSVCTFGPLNNELYADIEYLITNTLSLLPRPALPKPSDSDLLRLLKLAGQVKLVEMWRIVSREDDDLRAHVSLHRIFVRVKAESHQLLQESVDRLEPHDEWLKEHLGFSARSPAVFADAVLAAGNRRLVSAMPDMVSAPDFWHRRTHGRKFGADRLHLPDAQLRSHGAASLTFNAEELRELARRVGCGGDVEGLLARLSQPMGTSPPMPSFASRSSLYDRPFVCVDDHTYFLPLPTVLLEAITDTFLKDMMADNAYRGKVHDRKGSVTEQRCQRVLERIAQKDFVFPNPEAETGKEFADAVMWVGDAAAIVSAKSKSLPVDDGYPDAAELQRYVRKTLMDGLKQARGAKRKLLKRGSISVQNSRRGVVSLDAGRLNRLYLVVALDDRLPFSKLEEVLPPEELAADRDYPHVFYLNDFELILRELDTPTDLFQYLDAREELGRRSKYSFDEELDLLAYYLTHARAFVPVERESDAQDVQLFGFWDAYAKEGGLRKRKRQEDKVSYYIDSIIDFAHTAGGEYARAVELLAMLTRLERRMVAKRAFEKATLAIGSDRPRYDTVLMDRAGLGLLTMYSKEDRAQRRITLQGLTALAQHIFGVDTMLGVASEPADRRETSFDFVRIDIPGFTPDPETQALARQRFAPMDVLSESEYPAEAAQEQVGEHA